MGSRVITGTRNWMRSREEPATAAGVSGPALRIRIRAPGWTRGCSSSTGSSAGAAPADGDHPSVVFLLLSTAPTEVARAASEPVPSARSKG